MFSLPSINGFEMKWRACGKKRFRARGTEEQSIIFGEILG